MVYFFSQYLYFMRRPSLSIIIPTFNRGELLKRAVQSVVRQSLPCDEIIVVDDGSTDNTRDIIATFKSEGVPLHYHYQENKGPAAARNLGIKKSVGEYIGFLDSDDHFHRKKLERQFAELCRNKEYLISHTYEKWYRRGVHLNQKKIHIPRHGMIFDHCLQLCAVGMSTVLMKRKLFDYVGLFDEFFRCCEDYDFWLRVSCKYPFLLIPERLTIKEGGREDQLSCQYRVGMDRLRVRAIENLLREQVLSESQRKLAILELIKKAQIYGAGCKKHNNSKEADHYFYLAEKYRKKLNG